MNKPTDRKDTETVKPTPRLPFFARQLENRTITVQTGIKAGEARGKARG